MESLLLYNLQLFAPVDVADQRRYAVIDTGAAVEFAYGRLAGVQEEAGAAPIQGAVGVTQFGRGRLGSCWFLGKEFADKPLLLSDVAEYASVPVPVSLRLGASTLLAYPLVLDFKGLRIGFGKAPGGDSPYASVPITFAKGLPIIPLELGGQTLQALFDTGAGFSLANSAHVHEWRNQPLVAYSTDITDPTGASQVVPVGRSCDLSVAGVPLGDCEHLTMDLSAVEAHVGARIDLVLGVNTLLTSSAVWLLDPGGGRLYVTQHGAPDFA